MKNYHFDQDLCNFNSFERDGSMNLIVVFCARKNRFIYMESVWVGDCVHWNGWNAWGFLKIFSMWNRRRKEKRMVQFVIGWNEVIFHDWRWVSLVLYLSRRMILMGSFIPVTHNPYAENAHENISILRHTMMWQSVNDSMDNGECIVVWFIISIQLK